jgi:hypothetical protein
MLGGRRSNTGASSLGLGVPVVFLGVPVVFLEIFLEIIDGGVCGPSELSG